MKIAVVGSGYVGLCTAAGFAHLGHNVTCIDVDKEKVEKINRGTPPIYEENLANMLDTVVKNKMLKASVDFNDLAGAEIIFLAVGTPSKNDGSTELRYIQQASNSIGETLGDSYCVVVVKSTVPPETTENVVIPILERTSGKKAGKDFGVCMNPEFLREGKAIEDFLRPDRIIIGQIDKKSGDVLEKLYNGFSCQKKRTDLRTAELIKYASNAFLATKISFINEIGNLCKDLGIDVYQVAEGMGLDKRISPHFLEAGIGFGGSCFRKDVESLVYKSKQKGHDPIILNAALNVNRNQPMKIIKLLEKKTRLNDKTVAVLGLAFKENTDDIRDSPAVPIISELIKNGAKIKAYDPKASENMKNVFPQIEYTNTAADAIEDADACIILTAWKEFALLKDSDFDKMRDKIIIEGRRILSNEVSNFEGVAW